MKRLILYLIKQFISENYILVYSSGKKSSGKKEFKIVEAGLNAKFLFRELIKKL